MQSHSHRRRIRAGVAGYRRQASGFTLIEVAAAFGILAVSLGILYEVLASNLRRAAETERYERSWLIAESLLSESSAGTVLHEDVTTGAVVDGISWERRVERFDPGRIVETDIKPFAVTIVVRWGSRDAQALKLQSIVLARSTLQ